MQFPCTHLPADVVSSSQIMIIHGASCPPNIMYEVIPWVMFYWAQMWIITLIAVSKIFIISKIEEMGIFCSVSISSCLRRQRKENGYSKEMNTSKEQCVTWCATDVEWAEILLEKVLVPTVGGLGLLGNIVTIIVLNRSNPHNSKKSFYLLSFVIFSGQRWNPHFTRVWSPCLYLRLHSWYWWYLTTPWTSTHLRILSSSRTSCTRWRTSWCRVRPTSSWASPWRDWWQSTDQFTTALVCLEVYTF